MFRVVGTWLFAPSSRRSARSASARRLAALAGKRARGVASRLAHPKGAGKGKGAVPSDVRKVPREQLVAAPPPVREGVDLDATEGGSSLVKAASSHVDPETNLPRMVDVSEKNRTLRLATAVATLIVPATANALLDEMKHTLRTPASRPSASDGSHGASESHPSKKEPVAFMEEFYTPRKGPIFATAVIAGTNAVKQCSTLIPFCHTLPIQKCSFTFRRRSISPSTRVSGLPHRVVLRKGIPSPSAAAMATGLHARQFQSSRLPVERSMLYCFCTVATDESKTGVEMEALTGATVASLTLYDMLKSLPHAQEDGLAIGECFVLAKRGGRNDFVKLLISEPDLAGLDDEPANAVPKITDDASRDESGDVDGGREPRDTSAAIRGPQHQVSSDAHEHTLRQSSGATQREAEDRKEEAGKEAEEDAEENVSFESRRIPGHSAGSTRRMETTPREDADRPEAAESEAAWWVSSSKERQLHKEHPRRRYEDGSTLATQLVGKGVPGPPKDPDHEEGAKPDRVKGANVAKKATKEKLALRENELKKRATADDARVPVPPVKQRKVRLDAAAARRGQLHDEDDEEQEEQMEEERSEAEDDMGGEDEEDAEEEEEAGDNDVGPTPDDGEEEDDDDGDSGGDDDDHDDDDDGDGNSHDDDEDSDPPVKKRGKQLRRGGSASGGREANDSRAAKRGSRASVAKRKLSAKEDGGETTGSVERKGRGRGTTLEETDDDASAELSPGSLDDDDDEFYRDIPGKSARRGKPVVAGKSTAVGRSRRHIEETRHRRSKGGKYDDDDGDDDEDAESDDGGEDDEEELVARRGNSSKTKAVTVPPSRRGKAATAQVKERRGRHSDDDENDADDRAGTYIGEDDDDDDDDGPINRSTPSLSTSSLRGRKKSGKFSPGGSTGSGAERSRGSSSRRDAAPLKERLRSRNVRR